jgi:hypothetical protein
VATVTTWEVWVRVSFVRQPQQGQREARDAEAEFLQRPSAREGLGQALGQFIELVVQNVPFVVVGESVLSASPATGTSGETYRVAQSTCVSPAWSPAKRVSASVGVPVTA